MQDFEQLLESAAATDVGIGVLCTSRASADKLRQILYVVRAKAREKGITKYDELSLSISPHSGDILFIYKKVSDAGSK